MSISTFQRMLIPALAAFSILYGLTCLWLITTHRSVPLGCLIAGSPDPDMPGIEIRDTSRIRKCQGPTPAVGDHIVMAGGIPIRTYTDWARIQRKLASVPLDTSAQIPLGKDPSEENLPSSVYLLEYPDHTRTSRIWFLRPNESQPVSTWLIMEPEPTLGVSATLVWYVLQLLVVLVSGIAFWNRPYDVPVRTFYALSAVTMMAFIGGSHWWAISAHPLLIGTFASSAILLPAVLLHFFLVYPFPFQTLAHWPRLSRICLYAVPVLSSLLITGTIITAMTLSSEYGNGPFAITLERLAGELTARILPGFRLGIYAIFWISLIHFGLSLIVIQRSLRDARNAMERNQVRSLLVGAIVATVCIVYTIVLALRQPDWFALGGARMPMFLASLAYMLAYGIGIARYRLLLIDQFVSRGVWYYGATAGLAVIFAVLITTGAVNILQRDVPMLAQTVPLGLFLMTAVLLMTWGRDALQRRLDRRFFSEKYQLDKALNRMNRVVSSVLEPEAVSDSLLNSCRDVLHVDQAALYLRKSDRLEFRMISVAGRSADFPLQISLDPEIFETLSEHAAVQRLTNSQTVAQHLLRTLNAEMIHGLEMQGHIGGLLVMGMKPHGSPYSAEDLAFVSAMARIASVALHCARVQQDMARLNQDLQLKVDRIDDQERQLAALHQELSSLTVAPGPVSIGNTFHRGGIKGHSPAITHVLETVRKAAGSDSSVLVRGESGTGKELLARAIHENSPRAAGPLVSVHCAALSPALLESELFGHVKGAFTDARQDKIGRFQMAEGGTLFLDEIGDISLDVQVKLLRVLQERTFEPVGSSQTTTVDVRIVAATHRHLEQLIREGRFREDLFYRLNVISVTLPPLRERQEDLFELAIHFLRRASEKSSKQVLKIEDDALKAMQRYDWPGNIRELQNVIERAVVLAEGDSIRLGDLPTEFRRTRLNTEAHSDPTPAHSGSMPLPTYPNMRVALRRNSLTSDKTERESLQAALEQCSGNKAEAARLLGLPRSTFFSKLKKYGLN